MLTAALPWAHTCRKPGIVLPSARVRNSTCARFLLRRMSPSMAHSVVLKRDHVRYALETDCTGAIMAAPERAP
jgi:hypothetical protein